MEQIIEQVPVELIKAELTKERFLRLTNKGDNEIYIVTWQDSPNTLREIGRLREIAFRASGGGTGRSLDLDEFDLCENPYKQLIVWDPSAERIMGGYRYKLGSEWKIKPDGQPELATSHMFLFSETFMKKYAPWTVELGRSFVSREYQSGEMGRKSIFALDNLWDGLGAVTVIEPDARYLFGKFTMYPSFDRHSRDMIIYFLHKHFADTEGLVKAFHPMGYETDVTYLDQIFVESDFKSDYRILNKAVRGRGTNIPPLVNAYMTLSPTMKLFDSAINDEFGDVEETGILIDVEEILPEKRIRHIDSFAREHPELIATSSENRKNFYVLS